MGGGGKGSGKGTWKMNEQNMQDKGRGKKNTRMCVQTDRESVLNGPPPQGVSEVISEGNRLPLPTALWWKEGNKYFLKPS